MKLKSILYGLENLRAKGDLDIDIPNIENDSRKVQQGDMFIAIRGFKNDGTEYILDAIKNGAKVVLAPEDIDKSIIKQIPEGITIILHPDTRYALAICSCNFYDNPSKKFKLIGVTGTKGKTTTTYMMREILKEQGIKTGLVGTIAIYSGDTKLKDSDRTTPESLELQRMFARMVEDGCEVVIMEVSSQSLKLSRVAGCDFDMGVFTNFSEDHISPKEHPDMEDYLNSKLKLFTMCKKAFVNVDNIYSSKILNALKDCDVKTYGLDNTAMVSAKDITITNSYVDFIVKLNAKNERVKVEIPGRFSVYNALAAICVCQQLGCDTESIKKALQEVRVPGRSELVNNKKNLTIMLDYAHSPESLESILHAVKGYTKGKVISVFGCGGDRDTTKRAIMGEISGKIADYTIITSDNPRTEDPEEIVKEVESGIKRTKGKYVCIVDRKKAIEHAIKMAKKNDIVVLAGKGHETYQEVNGVKNPFDEKTIIKQIINKM